MRYLTIVMLLLASLCAAPAPSYSASVPRVVADQANDDYDRALALFKTKNYQEALTVLNGYLATHPSDAKALVLRGDTKSDLGDDVGALKDYNLAIEIAPQYEYAYVTRCETRLTLNQVAGAMDDCNHAIKLDPTDAVAYEDRADVFFQREDYKAALADYDKAIELGRSTPYVFAARCDAERINGLVDQAVSDCAKALALDPQARRAQWANGRLALVKNDYTTAIKYLGAYIAQKPDASDNAYYFRALALNRLQDYSHALSDINVYIKRQPSDPDGYQERAIARYGSGDKAGAIRDIEAAVRGYQKAGDTASASKATAMEESMRAGQFPKLP